MHILLSWISNIMAGLFSVLFLACAWVGLISIVFSLIGIVRKKCKFYAIFIYLGLSLLSSLLFKGTLWLNSLISTIDSVSTILFWTGVAVTGIIVLISIPKWLKDLWSRTNN